MDELRELLHDLSAQLSEALELARRAGYQARQLGLPRVDEQLEVHLLPGVAAFADDSPEAAQSGAVGQLLALLDEEP